MGQAATARGLALLWRVIEMRYIRADFGASALQLRAWEKRSDFHLAAAVVVVVVIVEATLARPLCCALRCFAALLAIICPRRWLPAISRRQRCQQTLHAAACGTNKKKGVESKITLQCAAASAVGNMRAPEMRYDMPRLWSAGRGRGGG